MIKTPPLAVLKNISLG